MAVSAWRRRSARAAVAVLLARLPPPVAAEGVQAVLRGALGDPTAAVFFRLPEVPGLVPVTGDVAADGGPDWRVAYPLAGADGELAVLTVGAADIDPDRVRAALEACRPALENARLQAMLHGHLLRARESRTQIVQMALAERKHLARNLHDGAQQHLHALAASLALARQKATRPEAVAVIDEAGEELQVAIGKLRGLGRDLYPPLLESDGLAAALESLGDEGPLDADVMVSAGRLAPETEIVMYLTVRELFDGLAGHCAASEATVTVTAAKERLSAAVTSDGKLGKGDPIPGWLSAVTDRVHAVGGETKISHAEQPDEAPEERIRVEAWIPCA
jgi:signal transduction histidine kinase